MNIIQRGTYGRFHTNTGRFHTSCYYKLIYLDIILKERLTKLYTTIIFIYIIYRIILKFDICNVTFIMIIKKLFYIKLIHHHHHTQYISFIENQKQLPGIIQSFAYFPTIIPTFD